MKRAFVYLFALVGSILMVQSAKAQVLGTVYQKQHAESRKPVPYQYLREADVMWSKTIWRKVPLREKINQSLYYPTQELDGRKSLIDLLLWAIDNEGLTAYNPDNQFNEFANPMTREEINVKFGAVDKQQVITELDGSQKVVVIPGQTRSYEVKEYLVKELWFFDKQRSIMDVRVIGICPVREYFKDQDVNQEDPQVSKLFWVYFPEVRNTLAAQEVFNPVNDAERRTFDDIFFKRYFSSFVFQESNAYDNRPIMAYTTGLESLLEAEKIKEKIFNYEHDLWEY